MGWFALSLFISGWKMRVQIFPSCQNGKGKVPNFFSVSFRDRKWRPIYSIASLFFSLSLSLSSDKELWYQPLITFSFVPRKKNRERERQKWGVFFSPHPRYHPGSNYWVNAIFWRKFEILGSGGKNRLPRSQCSHGIILRTNLCLPGMPCCCIIFFRMKI